jgi:MHS family proline/betaine transporter-like MFS transporter
VYAFLALEIGRAFFPAGDATVHLLQTFSIHAVAFIVRPLGGLLFGRA